ncbi:type II and III secretion system protein [Thioalkalivibrio sp. ALE19]|uniref:type II and III secretion system protein n=1 Tax=Thioalkalivibrio sp. ALE19 TaxID=1266909 RepID=UPI001E3C2E86|nr:type II and III secretion system protein [Thioalkalivibrio sp. ALE19]
MQGMWRKSLVAIGVSVLVSGCATLGQEAADETSRKNDDVMQQLQQFEAQQQREREQAQREQDRVGTADALPYVSTEKIPRHETLPPAFEKEIIIHEPHGVRIGNLMTKLGEATGIRMTFESDLVRQRGADAPDSTDSAGDEMSLAEMRSAADAGMTGADALLNDVRVALSHQGRVRDVLDAAANAMEARWRYDAEAGEVVFYRYVSETMRIAMTAGGMINNVTLQTQGDSGSGAESELQMESESSIWEDIESSLESMTSSQGAFSISDVMGTVTVRDHPDVVEEVEAYVERLNETFSRQVNVDVHIYSVDASEDDLRGLNWNALFQVPNLDFDISTPDGGGGSLSGGGAVISVPDRAAGRALSNFVGSEAFLESLNRVGEASTVTTTTLQTVNNQPAPVRIGQTISYLREVSETDTANVGTSATLTPGEIDVGLSMQVLPHVQDNGRDLLMQVMMNLSTLDNMEEFSSANNTIQLPEVTTRDFVQRTWLRSGEALVLAGFEEVQANLVRQGLLDADSWGVGGSRRSEQSSESLVIVITPTVTSVRDQL